GRFDKDFNELLAGPPTGKGAASVADTAVAHRLAGVKYYGQKTHEKKVLGYLDRARTAEFTGPQLDTVCRALAGLKRTNLRRASARLGRQRFPQDPGFFLVEAEYNLDLGPGRCPVYETRELLDKARQLAGALPRDERQQAVLDAVRRGEHRLALLNPF